MTKANPETVATYLRIPSSAHRTLLTTAQVLDVPISRVTSALFNYMLSPVSFKRPWSDFVAELRQHIGGPAVCLHDFEAHVWERDKHVVYSELEKIGLVEDFMWTRSSSGSGRVLCSFKISEAGRVIANIFDTVGALQPPDLTASDLESEEEVS